MRVRRAAPDDAAAIAGIHVRSWQKAYRGLIPDEVLDGLSVPERADMWRAAASEDPGHGALFVAERDGGLVGFCAVAEPSRDEDQVEEVAEIGALYVDPPAWRSGAGKALMEATLAHVQNRWPAVTLWVLEGNRPALEFYAAFGFADDGGRKQYGPSGTIGIRLRRSLQA